MAVGLKEPETLLPVKGIRAAAISCGIKKKQGSKDLVLFEIAAGSRTAAVFTRNLFCAAPVTLAKQHLTSAAPRYLLINSGNANAGTGARGMSDAQACCKMLADKTGCKPEEILPFSTGVIGEYLPLQKFADGIPQAIAALKEDAWMEAGRGIMTTDTLMKGISRQIVMDGKTVTISGVAKGSGMIHPNMATMLGYVATDASVSQSLLQDILQSAVNKSFNAISVDGDTSTNDSCVLIATGKAQNREIVARDESYKLLHQAVEDVCQYLAQAIVRDGEGATKLIILDVVNAVNESEARQAAFTIAHSPLVKTALFASDPNWGRILAAVGRSGVTMNMEKIRIHLGDVCIVENGGRASSYTEEQGQRVMAADEITIRVDLAAGNSSARVWTCDLSYEYVKINAEYRT